jgi:Tol biopolymer transport system component/DNA-binding winged helix-turn-helix (wHTH) protein
MRNSQIYQFGPFQLIPSERLLLRGAEIVELPPKVFDTLVLLVRDNGHVVAKDEIMRTIWPDSFVEEGNLTRNISVLRKALNSENSQHQYIDTVPKVGYRFIGEVNELGAHSADLAIERLTVSKTSIIEEEEIGLKTYPLLSPLRQLRWGRWGAKSSLAIVGLATLGIFWFLLARTGSKTEEARGEPIVATFNQVSSQPGVEVFPSLSPDGKLVVYASNREGNWDIYLQRVGGQTAINLTADSPSEDTHPAFSPDGNRIAFRSWRDGGGLFVMGATGENVRRIADFGYHPAWSPDGKEIVFAMAKVVDSSNRSVIPSQLWAVNVATGEKRLITDGDAVQPQWSPKGHRIAYWGLQKGGQRDIWTVSSHGSQRVAVTDDEYFNWNPIWSPDGEYLYFVSDRAGSMNVWRVPIEERSGKVLGKAQPVTMPSSYSQHISFSRDGQHIAYVRVANQQNIKRVTFDPDSERLAGDLTWITQGDKHTGSPDVSPDGQWLTFDSQGDKQEDIFVAKTDGSALRQLTEDTYRDRGPRWSADGKRIAFYSDRGGKYEIWVVNFDGTGLRQITSTSASSVFYPVWSPDSTRLIYRTRGSPATIVEVGIPWQQQSPESLPPLASDSELSFTPWSWSFDGRKLAGWRRTPEDAHSGIFLYSLDSKQFDKLTDFGNRPVWLSDNRRLLFFYHDKLYLLDTSSEKIKELLSTAPDQIHGLTVSRSTNLICFSIEIAEADIWVATFR